MRQYIRKFEYNINEMGSTPMAQMYFRDMNTFCTRSCFEQRISFFRGICLFGEQEEMRENIPQMRETR